MKVYASMVHQIGLLGLSQQVKRKFSHSGWMGSVAVACGIGMLCIALIVSLASLFLGASSACAPYAYADNSTSFLSTNAQIKSNVAYRIVAAADNACAITPDGESVDNGARAVFSKPTAQLIQQYRIVPLSNGYYKILNLASNKALDVMAAQATPLTPVQFYEDNGTPAQQWKLVPTRENRFVFQSRLSKTLVLDWCDGHIRGSNKLQITRPNGSWFQEFCIQPLGVLMDEPSQSGDNSSARDNSNSGDNNSNTDNSDNSNSQAQNDPSAPPASAPGAPRIESGSVYELQSALNRNVVVGVVDGSRADGAGIELESRDTRIGQYFRFDDAGDGYYTLINIASGKALDVQAASSDNGTPVWSYESNGTAAQQWKPVWNGSSFTLYSRLSPRVVLDIPASDARNGAALWIYEANKTPAQNFRLIFHKALTQAQTLRDAFNLSKGPFAFRSMLDTNEVLDVADGSRDDAANVQVYSWNGTRGQLYTVTSAGEGIYRIANAGSGKNVNVAWGQTKPGSNVQQYEDDATLAGYWFFKRIAPDVFGVFSAKSGLALDVCAGQASDGQNIWVWEANGTPAQQWQLSAEELSTIPQPSPIPEPDPNPAPRPNPAPLPSGSVLNGVDISHYQDGIDLDITPFDFAIMKATEGYTYVDRTFNRFVRKSIANNKKIGAYSFARQGDWKAQADHFIKNVRPYLGNIVLVLDWETQEVTDQGPQWAKQWLDYVYQQTGVRPLIYMSKSVTRAYDWTAVARDYKLWVAQYGLNEPSGYQEKPWTDSKGFGAWSAPTLFQYSSSGRLPGYDGDIDLDMFYGTPDDWDSLAAISR